jgi:PAS domain S-box-containing protein
MDGTIKLLVLDGPGAVAGLLKKELRGGTGGLQIKQAATGGEFVVQLAAFAPDLIVVRHTPPEGDGLAALAAARAECGEAAFIIVCAANHADVAIEALHQGATDFVLEEDGEQVVFTVRRVLRDVGQRRQRAATWTALQDTAERYRALFERSGDCLFLHDLDGKFIDANPATLSLLGYDRAEVPQITLQSAVCEEDVLQALRCMEEVKRVGSTKNPVEWNLRHKKGRRVVVEVNGSLVTRGGKPFAVHCVGRDITHRNS